MNRLAGWVEQFSSKAAQRIRAMSRMGGRLTPGRPSLGWAVLWLRSSFLPSQNYLILLSIGIGLLTGLGSVGFVKLLDALSAFVQGELAGGLGVFGAANLVLLPAMGGLLAGPLINRFAPEARGHGVPEVMTALATGGVIRRRVVAIKILASALTIGFGGAAGREGPMVQIGSAVGSIIGQLSRVEPDKVRTLIACGAAGGIAATFNAPIGGAIFAMEVLMGRLHTDFLLVLLTSLSSCMVARGFLGNYPAFFVSPYELKSPAELPLYFVMGLVCGLAATVYVRTLYRAEALFGDWRFPSSLKPAVGGLMVGLVLRFFPQVYGTGLHAVEGALWARFPWEILLALFFAELCANVATLGSGGSGGIFAPSLFMGAMLGGAFGTLAHGLNPDLAAGPGAYAMVGMAAFFAAAAKAPTTSILILFEMTNDYRIMLPLMAAVVASTYVSHSQLPYSIYTLKLSQRGIKYPYEPDPADIAQSRQLPAGPALSDG